MSNRPARFTTALTTRTFASYFSQTYTLHGGQTRVLRELFYADPLMLALDNYTRVVKSNVVVVTYRDKSPKHLDVSGKSPYIYGLALLQRFLKSRRRKRRRAAFPSWNRRRSLSVYGDYSGLSVAIPSGIWTGFVLPLTIGLIDGRMSRLNTTTTPVSHCSFDDCLRMARSMLPFIGSVFQKVNGSIYGKHTLSSLSVSEDLITYRLIDVEFKSFPSGNWQNAPALNVTISRNSFGDPSIDVFGYSSVVINKNPNLPKVRYYSGADAVSLTVSEGDEVTSRLLHRSIQDLFGVVLMNQFRPALYHTQGGALAKLLVNYGKNFENFIEAPQLLTLFRQMYEFPIMAKSVLGLDWYGRLKWLTECLTGSILAQAFAVRPTFESLQALASQACYPVIGEKEMKFETNDINSLPEGLRLFLEERVDMFLNPANITYFYALFRTEVTSAPDEAVLARAVMEHDPLAFLGLYPTPRGVWDSTQFTFIIDWFVPIGRTISDNESYFRSPMLECRIGHSVHFQISTVEGLHYDLFWRSSYGDRPTDPPGDSWLVSPGIPSISIPLAVSMLLSGRRYE